MSERDLSILDDEAQRDAKADAAEDERLTKAGEVEVYQLVVDDDGTEHRGPLLRIEPAYTHVELRRIQRVEWGDWWKKRRKSVGSDV